MHDISTTSAIGTDCQQHHVSVRICGSSEGYKINACSCSEMEMMIGLSKNELRKTRMELMNARMESKASLAETKYLTELVNSKKEKTRRNADKIQVR